MAIATSKNSDIGDSDAESTHSSRSPSVPLCGACERSPAMNTFGPVKLGEECFLAARSASQSLGSQTHLEELYETDVEAFKKSITLMRRDGIGKRNARNRREAFKLVEDSHIFLVFLGGQNRLTSVARLPDGRTCAPT